jgi:hypothetical protein
MALRVVAGRGARVHRWQAMQARGVILEVGPGQVRRAVQRRVPEVLAVHGARVRPGVEARGGTSHLSRMGGTCNPSTRADQGDIAASCITHTVKVNMCMIEFDHL